MSVQTKAVRLLAQGRVAPDPEPAQVFRVAGDHGAYTVIVGPHVALCTCPASTRCSHVEAAVLWANARPEDRALLEDALEARKARERAEAEAIFARLGA